VGCDVSFVITVPELMQGAAREMAGIGSSVADATASASGPTSGIAAAAQDEVSAAIAALFGTFGRQFQAVSAQAHAFNTQFAHSLSASAAAYATQDLNAFGANAAGLAATGPAPASNTLTDARLVFAASRQSLTSLVGGISTGLHTLFANPATFFNNLGTAFQSVALIGAPDSVTAAVAPHTLGGVTMALGGLLGDTPVDDVHLQVWQGLTGLGDFATDSSLETALVKGIANFAASPLSGVLIGFAGPLVSPGVQLFNSAGTIFADLTGGNPAAALTALVNTPGDVVNAFFNGATLNLDPLVPLFNPYVMAGSDGGEHLTGLSLAFGGLFSPGQVVTGVTGPTYYGAGGSLLNSLGLDLSFFPPDDDAGATLAIPAIPVGPIAATAGLIDVIGNALGGTLLS
jgi:hypothetical protein